MSIVRYTNKKTGVVSLYESTSHYDPETKQSRPVRKYLGTEDPETGQLIPSSGRRGRKASAIEKNTSKEAVTASMRAEIESLKKELEKKNRMLNTLEEEVEELKAALLSVRDTSSAALKAARNK